MLIINKILKRTKVEGPGLRFCIWVQGCSKHCEGCFSKETWDFKLGSKYSVEEIFELIKNEKDIEGVTFLGGEPFEQAKELSVLAKKIKSTGLSLVTFSGKTYEELKSSDDININSLLSYTDLLIDGDFRQDLYDLSRPWVGSKNQRYIFLTDRYSIDDIKKYKNQIEVHINNNGIIFANGMGDFSAIKEKILYNKYKKEHKCQKI